MKRVLVIGGTKGIGRVIALNFCARGYDGEIAGRARPWDPNTSTPADVIVLAQRYRGIEDPWKGELACSLTLTQQVLTWAGETCPRGSSVILISSVAGRVVLSEQSAEYHVAKAGMEALVRFYAVQLGPKGIRVNAIAPGATVKPESRAFYAQHPELSAIYETCCPLGRMGTAEDVAGVALFLASDAAAFLTGQTIVLDGGFSCVGQEALARQLSAAKELKVTQ